MVSQLSAFNCFWLSPDAPRFAGPPLGRELPDPDYFLRHRWDGLLAHLQAWATCITHGDLNLNNVLVDERGHRYVTDFSETRIRNVAADFAPGRGDRPAATSAPVRAGRPGPRPPPHRRFTPTPRLDDAAGNGQSRTTAAPRRHPRRRSGALAATRVADPAHEEAYVLPLLEWSLPIVAFRPIEPERTPIAAWASGLMLERILATLGLPLPGSGP